MEAGLFVPCFLAASAACDAAFAAAAAAGGTQHPGAAETGCGWPSLAPALVQLPAVAGGAAAPSSGAVSSGDLGTGEPSPSDSYSSAPEDSSQPWPAVAAAVACWASALLLAWCSCSAWLGWGARLLAALAQPAVVGAPAAPVGCQAAPPCPAGSGSLHTWLPAA